MAMQRHHPSAPLWQVGIKYDLVIFNYIEALWSKPQMTTESIG